MAELGPGTRVWIAWVPDHRCREAPEARCRTGTVTGESTDPRARMLAGLMGTRYWSVDIDGFAPLPISIDERFLYPIDDDDAHDESDRVAKREDKGAHHECSPAA